MNQRDVKVGKNAKQYVKVIIMCTLFYFRVIKNVASYSVYFFSRDGNTRNKFLLQFTFLFLQSIFTLRSRRVVKNVLMQRAADVSHFPSHHLQSSSSAETAGSGRAQLLQINKLNAHT